MRVPDLTRDVQVEFSGIDRRQEILAEKRHQSHGDRRKAKDQAGEHAAVAEAETQQVAIALSELFESMLKTLIETGGPTNKKPKTVFSVRPDVRWFPPGGLGSRYIAKVGTSVRDRIYEAIRAKITASANGVNRYFGYSG